MGLGSMVAGARSWVLAPSVRLERVALEVLTRVMAKVSRMRSVSWAPWPTSESSMEPAVVEVAVRLFWR